MRLVFQLSAGRPIVACLRHAAIGLMLSACVIIFSACTAEKGDDASAEQARTASVSGDPVRGLALLNNFRDSLPANSGNALRCTSCHLDNGTRKDALPWLGSAARYPQYRARSGRVEDMESRINECITRSLAGRMLSVSSREMRDMVAYMETLRNAPRPADHQTIKLKGDSVAGSIGYSQQCARCHGVNGEGVAGVAPALWGLDSYSIGAGMARQFTLATFARHNMPYDRPGTLSDQQAADIAAYVLHHSRQDLPGKENDWPNGDPPADVAYKTHAAEAAGKSGPSPMLLGRRVTPDSLKP